MSEGAGGGGQGGGAPAPGAPAAPAAADGQAAAPVDPLAELDAHVAKAGLKYKAAGKERQVSSIKELLRKAEQADGMQAKASELIERERRIQAAEERDARLKQARTPKERIAILRELAGDDFDTLAEETVLERIEREKAQQGMSPAERQARAEAEQYRRQLEAYEAEKAKAQQEAEQRQQESELEALRGELAGHVVKALQAAKLPKGAAADGIRRTAALMQRAAALGVPLQPDELAADAVRWAAEDFRAYTQGLEGESLFEFLGEDVVRRASKAWLSRGQAQQAPKATLPPVGQPAPKPVNGTHRKSAMASWRDLLKGE